MSEQPNDYVPKEPLLQLDVGRAMEAGKSPNAAGEGCVVPACEGDHKGRPYVCVWFAFGVGCCLG